MAKFVYKFESIKKVKEALEKKAQKEVALIEMEIDKQRSEYNRIADKESSSRRNGIKKEVSVAEIKFKKNYEQYLSRQKAAVMEKIIQLEKNKKTKLEELVQKSKEHKIFDSLEENYHDNFNKEQSQQELKFIDELATQKFIRQAK